VRWRNATLDVAPNGALPTLAAAVELARPGDRIIVHAGTYRGPTATVTTPRITIEGQGAAVLDGEDARGLIVIKADDVTVRGLTLRNVGTSFVEDRAALRVDNARGCIIDDNRVENGFFGIYLANVTDCASRTTRPARERASRDRIGQRHPPLDVASHHDRRQHDQRPPRRDLLRVRARQRHSAAI
jgi:parallel beta-helix repeat protein